MSRTNQTGIPRSALFAWGRVFGDKVMSDQRDTELILNAISFAAHAHDGQLRKDRCTPYVAHPFRVMTVLRIVFQVTDPELLAAAALHDTIEDTKTDRDELAERLVTAWRSTWRCCRRTNARKRSSANETILRGSPVRRRA